MKSTRNRRRPVSAEAIARRADRGEDISGSETEASMKAVVSGQLSFVSETKLAHQ